MNILYSSIDREAKVFLRYITPQSLGTQVISYSFVHSCLPHGFHVPNLNSLPSNQMCAWTDIQYASVNVPCFILFSQAIRCQWMLITLPPIVFLEPMLRWNGSPQKTYDIEAVERKPISWSCMKLTDRQG